MTARRLFACGVTAGIALLRASSGAQTAGTQQPVFRSGATLNIVDVTVTDKQGRTVEGLTAGDFTLTEDGVPQTISFVAFQRVDSGDAAALPPAPPPPATDSPRVAPTVQPQIASSPAGAVRYRD